VSEQRRELVLELELRLGLELVQEAVVELASK